MAIAYTESHFWKLLSHRVHSYMVAGVQCRRWLDIRQTLACNLGPTSSSKVWIYNYHIDSYLHTYIEVNGLWGWCLLCTSMSLSILNFIIVPNAFSSHLKTHKSQTSPRAASRGVAKLSTSLKVTISLPLVPYYFISDQCLKGDCWTALFLRNSIVAIDLWSLSTHKTGNILKGETCVSINFLANTHLTLYRFKYIKLFQAQNLAVFEITILGNLYSFQKFCNKLAKFLPSKMCFMVIGSSQIC